MNFWKIGTLILFLALSGGVVFYFVGELNKPSDTVRKFHNALCDGDVDAAETLMSASVPLAKEWLRGGLGQFTKDCKENKGLEEILINGEQIDDEVAAVSGETIYKNGVRSKFQMKLYHEKSKWKIAWNPKK